MALARSNIYMALARSNIDMALARSDIDMTLARFTWLARCRLHGWHVVSYMAL